MPQPLKVPLFYRVMLQWLEPLMALQGAFLAAQVPKVYLNTMTPHAVYDPTYQVVLDQLAATYTLFALVEILVLRATSELKVWKAVMLSIMVCDVIHIYATAKALGVDVFLSPSSWRMEDAVNIIILYGMFPVRLGVVFEVGF